MRVAWEKSSGIERDTGTCSRCIPEEVAGAADRLDVKSQGMRRRRIRMALRLLTRASGYWCCHILVWDNLGGKPICGRVGVVEENPVFHHRLCKVWDVHCPNGEISSNQQDAQGWSSEESWQLIHTLFRWAWIFEQKWKLNDNQRRSLIPLKAAPSSLFLGRLPFFNPPWRWKKWIKIT